MRKAHQRPPVRGEDELHPERTYGEYPRYESNRGETQDDGYPGRRGALPSDSRDALYRDRAAGPGETDYDNAMGRPSQGGGYSRPGAGRDYNEGGRGYARGHPRDGSGVDARSSRDYRADRPAGGERAAYRRPIDPKGYVRSDERIRELLCEKLSVSGLDVSDVSVEVKNGHALLEGTVRERWIKHAIEDTADQSVGVKEVENRIRVGMPGGARPGDPGAQRPESQAGQAGSDPLSVGTGDSFEGSRGPG